MEVDAGALNDILSGGMGKDKDVKGTQSRQCAAMLKVTEAKNER
jgi:hypothetical protein